MQIIHTELVLSPGTLNSLYESVAAFEKEMKITGKPCKPVGYEGAEHGFINSGEYSNKTPAEADNFLVELG